MIVCTLSLLSIDQEDGWMAEEHGYDPITVAQGESRVQVVRVPSRSGSWYRTVPRVST